MTILLFPISSALLQALLVFLLSVCRRRKRFILATTLTFKGRAPLCRLLAVITPSPSPMFMLRVPNYSSDLFGYPALHPIYDEMTGDCVGVNDCAAMFNTSDWIPIVGGIIALDGVNVSVAGASPRVIMPQPQALVVDKDGNTVTIYAGSLLLPKENLIFRRSNWIRIIYCK